MIPAYKVTNVFDVSQTSGEPIPSLVNELSGDVEEYNKFIEAIKKTSTVPIKFAEIDTSAKGYYNIEDKCIVIKENMSEVQTAKTLIHEIAHSILHEKDNGIEKEADRNTKRYKLSQLHMPLVSISILIHLIIHLDILPDGQAVKMLKSYGTV